MKTYRLDRAIEKIDWMLAKHTEQFEDKFIPIKTNEQKADWILRNPGFARTIAYKVRGVGKDTWEQYLNHYGLTEQYSIVKSYNTTIQL